MVKIMGVLNVTPDSFSDGGSGSDGTELVEQGADIVDIGAESTRPGSRPVSAEEEIARLGDRVSALSKKVVVSVDTYKSEVARWALNQGASIINDVSGLRADPEMAGVIAQAGCQVVIMHSKEQDELPHATGSEVEYKDIVSDISEWLLSRVEYAKSSGIKEKRIILDPGMGGFISTKAEDSWELLARLNQFIKSVKPFPVLIGVSRKKFLGGETLKARDLTSAKVARDCIETGASYIRTHNVELTRSVLA